jgi:tRNA(fMet)-specific endonuclease VapC
MTAKYMLDTNICIYLMKHQPPEVAARFAQCFVGEVVISAITLAELEYGVACSGTARDHNRPAMDGLLEDIAVAAFDARAARACGPIRASKRASDRASNRERNKDALDKLIAAHAVALGVTLVTNNESDFHTYPGLTLENWVPGQ